MAHAVVPLTPASSRQADIEYIIRDMVARASILSRSLSRLQPSRRQQLTQYAAISIGSVSYWDGCGSSAASGGTCGEVVVPGTASQAVVQKSATGAAQLVPNPAMMSNIIFFAAGLDNALTRPHHDTSTGNTSTFSFTIVSTTSSTKGTFSTRHRTRT